VASAPSARLPMLIQDRRWPGTTLRRTGLAPFVALILLAPSQGWAQTLQSFEDLALRVNLYDHLRVEDQSGATATGRLTRLARNDMAIQTNAGEKRFTSDTVRSVAVRGHALRRGALVGAGVFAVLGAVAICSHRGGGDCGIVGPLGAAPIGAGVGLAVGALIPQMKPVYRAPQNPISVPASHAPGGDQASLLEDLALRVDLDDRLRVEDQSGVRTTGRLTHLTADEMTIQTPSGEKRFTRANVRQVAVRRQPLRMATLIGAGAGAVYGALSECRGGAHADCPGGLIIGSALGAGAGAVAGTFIDKTTIVYPEPQKRTYVLPAISRGAVSVRVSRRW
jgi:hypothetical protein